MAQQHAEARGIAEVFAREFYQRFNVDRNAVAPFYAGDAVTFFDGQSALGAQGIAARLRSTPALSLAPQQLDVETTASPAAMLIMVTGACTLQTSTGTVRRPFSHVFTLVRNADNSNAYSIAQEVFRTAQAPPQPQAAASASAAALGAQQPYTPSPSPANGMSANNSDKRSIYVGNVDYATTKEELAYMFQRFGEIKRVSIPLNRETNQPKGRAYIEFASPDAAARALTLNGFVHRERQLRIQPYEKKQHDPNDMSDGTPAASYGEGGSGRGYRGRGRGGYSRGF